MPDQAPTLKMFGLQRTCTNVILKGLTVNFHVRSVEHGREWKHGPVKRSGDDVRCLVFCFREPLAWLVSMYRFSFTGAGNGCPHFRRRWSFADFLAGPHYEWPTPLDRWNAMNRHYLEWIAAHPDRGIAVRSEDMMSAEDARRQYLRIGEHFGLARRSEHVHVFRRRITPTQKIARRAMDFAYYQDRRYLTQYTPEDQAAVLRAADPWVMAQLGYQAGTVPAAPHVLPESASGDETRPESASGDETRPESASPPARPEPPDGPAIPIDPQPDGAGRVQPQPGRGRGV
jgi:hypothetical protein